MPSGLALAARLARPLSLDRQIDFWLREANATWSLDELRARVVDVIAETADTKTFVLQPNRHWRVHRAGQHATVDVEIDGVRVRRCYSISSAPTDPLPAITVKRAGRVSGWLHDQVREGHVLHLGPAAGEFVLPDPVPRRLLLLAGGSGVTPLMAMLRELAARAAVRDVVFVHHARSRDDLIFGRELESLAARHAGLRLVLFLSDGTCGPGRFDETHLRRLVPDLADRETFLCAPAGLMARVERMWGEAGASARLRRERFAPFASPAPRGAGEEVRVTLAKSGRSFVARGEGTLLEQLERGGARPRSGCRMGICQSCKCRKRSGVVEDLRTGAISSAPDEDVQPCVTVARSDVELCL